MVYAGKSPRCRYILLQEITGDIAVNTCTASSVEAMRGVQNFFLTSPANRERNDIRCPFGCRKEWRHTNAVRRVQEYYQTEEGKMKKKKLNQRRYRKGKQEECIAKQPEITCEDGNEDIIEHMVFLASLTEEREVSTDEVREFYNEQVKKQRQQGLPFWRKWFKVRDG